MNNEQQIKEEIVRVGKLLYARELVSATDGNISVKIGSDRVIATPSGVSKGDFTVDDLVVVDMAGNRISDHGTVTTEIRMHLEAYRVRPDISAVVHAHPMTITAFTVAGIPIPQGVIPEVVFSMGTIPTAQYATPASGQGPAAVRKLIANSDAVILDRHGAITVGETAIKAYHKMEKLEDSAKIIFMAKQLGRVNILPMDEIENLVTRRQKAGVAGRIQILPETCTDQSCETT